MAELVLMERAGERMNVPAEKVAEFLTAGWREISRTSMPDAPVVEAPVEDEDKPAAKRTKKG